MQYTAEIWVVLEFLDAPLFTYWDSSGILFSVIRNTAVRFHWDAYC